MDSSLILRATLFGMILLGLLIPGYLGSVKKEYSRGIEPQGVPGSLKSRCGYQGIKTQGVPGSLKSRCGYQGMKKQAALERRFHLRGAGSPGIGAKGGRGKPGTPSYQPGADWG